MVISNPSFSSTPITDFDVVPLVIEILDEEPNLEVEIVPPRPPGQVVGSYNGSTDSVDLYIVNGTGNFWLRCT